MFGSLGFPEILFILVLALLVFGPRRLPEVGRTIGRALGEFRRATGDLKRSFDQETSSFERAADSDSTVAVTPPTPAAPDRGGKLPAETSSSSASEDSDESDAAPEDTAEEASEDRETS